MDRINTNDVIRRSMDKVGVSPGTQRTVLKHGPKVLKWIVIGAVVLAGVYYFTKKTSSTHEGFSPMMDALGSVKAFFLPAEIDPSTNTSNAETVPVMTEEQLANAKKFVLSEAEQMAASDLLPPGLTAELTQQNFLQPQDQIGIASREISRMASHDPFHRVDPFIPRSSNDSLFNNSSFDEALTSNDSNNISQILG